MNIAYFLDTAVGLGGAGNLLLMQARAIKEVNTVCVIIPVDGNGVPNAEYVTRCERWGLKYYCMPVVTAFNFKTLDLFQSLKCISDTYSFLKDNHIELIHSIQLNIAADICARTLNIPHLMSIYQLKPYEFRYSFGNLFAAYHLCDSILYSELWKEMKGMVSRVIRPISPIEQLEERQILAKDEIVFLMVGRVCRRKNQLGAIRAIEQIRNKYKVKLLIAGELVESYAQECIKYVESKGLSDSIDFLDFVSEVGSLMKTSDVFLCCSNDESFPTSIVEAVSYDMTVLTTPAGGIGEVFKDGENAIVLDDFSDESLICGMMKCIEMYVDGTVEHLHENSRLTWKAMFEENGIVDRLDGYYSYILENYERREIDNNTINEAYIILGKLVAYDSCFALFRNRILYLLSLYHEISCKKAYIWGAGKYGGYAYGFLQALRPDVSIEGFIDKNRTGEYCGVPILKPSELNWKNDSAVIIAYVGSVEETISELETKGYSFDKNIYVFN